MAEILPLADAVRALIQDGDVVSLEGFTHLIPHAVGHEIIRQHKKDLTLVRLTPDIISDQLVGAGCIKKLVFSWGGNPGVGSLYRFRDAVERGWPRKLLLDEHTHAGMAARYVAGASRLPFGILRGYLGTDLLRCSENVATVSCPFTGETVAAVPAINPQVTAIHAQRADRRGNVQLWGILGVQKEAVLAATKVIVTVEELVGDLEPMPGAIVLPHWIVSAISVVPQGAHPSYTHGYYARDNDFYLRWDAISRDRDLFINWVQDKILQTADHAEHIAAIASTEYTHV